MLMSRLLVGFALLAVATIEARAQAPVSPDAANAAVDAGQERSNPAAQSAAETPTAQPQPKVDAPRTEGTAALPAGEVAPAPESGRDAASPEHSNLSTTTEKPAKDAASSDTHSNASTSDAMKDTAKTDGPAAQPSQAAIERAEPEAGKDQSAAATAPQPPAPTKPRLAITSGSGAFADAFRMSVLDPFTTKTGVEITAANSDSAASPDVLLLDAAELDKRCTAGELASLDVAELVPTSSGPSLRDDFIDGGLKPCGVATLAWSNVFVYDPGKFEAKQPRSLSDVFDVKKFRGVRALPASGRGLFEALLLADGVAPRDVYRSLETSEGISRALRRLRALGSNLLWYENTSEAIASVRAGKASIALTSNGHAFIEQARGGPLGLISDGQIVHASYLAVSKAARDAAHARDLVAFATGTEQIAAVALQIPYGPMRRSAIEQAMRGRHPVTGQDLAPFLPTAPDNLRNAVTFDAVWWQANQERMTVALNTVRFGPPLPTRP